jgi:hypothetical protein
MKNSVRYIKEAAIENQIKMNIKRVETILEVEKK